MAAPPKAPDAFRTIGEVADWLGVSAHVLRFWESRFPQVKPVKRAGGRRYYRPADMALLGGIRHLLHEDGLTIKGVQKVLREQGIKAVAAHAPPLAPDVVPDAGAQPDLFAQAGPGPSVPSAPSDPDPPRPAVPGGTAADPAHAPRSGATGPGGPAPTPGPDGRPAHGAPTRLPGQTAEVPLHEALARLPRGRIPRLKLVTILGAARRLRDRLATAG